MVKIVQLLCPQRHCILATAYEEERANFEDACKGLELMVSEVGPYKRQCMICGSRDLRFEEGTTKFKTLVEAAPALTQTMYENIETRRELDRMGKTIEPIDR
jgi:hypothetical protein